MPIKDIKNFINWCTEGDVFLQHRHDLFLECKAMFEAQMEELTILMETLV